VALEDLVDAAGMLQRRIRRYSLGNAVEHRATRTVLVGGRGFLDVPGLPGSR
jgi:hypothetical protein